MRKQIRSGRRSPSDSVPGGGEPFGRKLRLELVVLCRSRNGGAPANAENFANVRRATPQITTTAAGDMLIATYAGYSQNSPPGSSWSAPSGMTREVNVNNQYLLSISNDDRIQSGAGASGTFSSTASPSQTYALTALVALKR